ncbi:MAG: hypothetical protein L3K15_09210 [Thermoplasmata archaeon]|nr:hypothetical protein [Thermoplasmata archaeon]
MPDPGRRRRPRWLGPVALALVLVALTPSEVAASPYPVLPLAVSNAFVSNLTVPVLGPGASGSLTWTLHDPLGSRLDQVVVVFQVYAFNAYPGNATSSAGAGPAPELSNGNGSFGAVATFAIGAMAARSQQTGATPVIVPGSTALGDYAVRCSLRFSVNATGYYLASRGFFTASAWSYATNGANAPTGLPTLNVSRLNVSGVVPETAVAVLASSANVWIYALLGGAIVAAGVGGFYTVRRGPGSSAGARNSREPSNAESAFGNSRTNDGD